MFVLRLYCLGVHLLLGAVNHTEDVQAAEQKYLAVK